MSKGSAIISILIAFVGGLLIGNLTSGGGGEDGVEVADDVQPEADARGASAVGDVERFNVPVTGDQPVKGAEGALVTIVEFSDFQCPFCSRVNPTIRQLMEDYEGKIRVVWRNQPLPMHQDAPLAHQAAMEAYDQGGDEKFWEMHDVLFENQRALSRSDLESYAERLGLNMDEFRQALDDNEHESKVQADMQLASRVGARGTPHFFINGRRLAGAQPVEEFKSIIDEEIGRAEQMLEAGVDRAAIYATFMDGAQSEQGQEKQPAGREAAQKQRRPQPDPDAVYRVPVSDEPTKGPDNALVTIVEFSDFECPFCSRVGGTLQQIEERYGNDVRIMWMNNPLPFHDNAKPAAIAALEVYQQGGDEKFWQYHDILFENQQGLTRENLEQWAQEIGGINMAQFRQALDTNEHEETINEQQQLARSLGATGTPAFFINGRNLRGAQPLPAFTSVIDEELAKAREMVQNGTPRARLYATIIEDGATSPQMIQPEGGGGGGGAEPAEPEVYEIPVPDDAPARGPDNAPVTIQLFSDFECPFCSRVRPTLDQIEEEYGRQVRILWRNYPLPMHDNAELAAQAAWEVFRQGGDEKFWQYHDILFENQRALQRENLEQYAQQVGGINMAQFRQALDTNRHQARVQQDMAAVREAGARIGTPSAFIDGRLVQGAQPFPAFKAQIDRALEE